MFVITPLSATEVNGVGLLIWKTKRCNFSCDRNVYDLLRPSIKSATVSISLFYITWTCLPPLPYF